MKRSSQVALLLMGATGVGAGAYAMTPPRDCVPPGSPAAAIAPGRAAASRNAHRRAGRRVTPATARGRAPTRNSHWSRPIFSRSSSSIEHAVDVRRVHQPQRVEPPA